MTLRQEQQTGRSIKLIWEQLPILIRILFGIFGSTIVLLMFWQVILIPLSFPALNLIGQYFWDSLGSIDTYKAFIATGIRALLATVIGFGLALVLAILTGRTIWGWCSLFFLLICMQKIPAIALVNVLVGSKLGIGFATTVVLASTVVMTFTWLILHHRASTLDPKEVFALRVVGFRGWQLGVNGLLPHLGSAIGGAARLAASIALVMVILGEWQGVWEDGSLWQYGLGVQISRAYNSINSDARILAACLWLGVLGLVMDSLVQGGLRLVRFFTGIDLSR